MPFGSQLRRRVIGENVAEEIFHAGYRGQSGGHCKAGTDSWFDVAGKRERPKKLSMEIF